MSRSEIDYVDVAWNPVIGCSKLSSGCTNCWAERMAHRFAANPATPWAKGIRWDGSDFRLREDELLAPFSWTSPRVVAACFMTDLFHPNLPFRIWSRVMGVLREARRHTFLLLTKRPWGVTELRESFRGVLTASARNRIWLGVSGEDQTTVNERLLAVPKTEALHTWVSVEPMLGPLHLPSAPLDWVVAGGKYGPGARPCHPKWVRALRQQCADARIPFYFKHWGSWKPVSDMEWLIAGTAGRKVCELDGQKFAWAKGREAGAAIDGAEVREVPPALRTSHRAAA